MTQADATSVAPLLARLPSLASLLKRSLKLHDILVNLAAGELSATIPFDVCCLVVPAEDCGGAERSSRLMATERGAREVSTKYLPIALTPFARALASGAAPYRLRAEELGEMESALLRHARAALVLPLGVEETNFGALCFASDDENAYSSNEASDLAELADTLALAARAALDRERLSATEETGREVERLKRGFVNTLVRDVRLPLTNVLGLLELFDSKLQTREPFDMEDRQLLAAAIGQGGRMRRLVDELLEVTRQQEEKISLNLEQFPTADFLSDAIEPFRGEAALRGVELRLSVGAGTPDLHVDARQARRAVCNLLSVALASTPDGGQVHVEAKAIKGTRVGDEGRRFLLISITDTGAGLSPEEVPYVFDAFQLPSSARREAGRGGPTLAITKRIAVAHGGNVAVRSQLGAGTTYSILFPAPDERPDAALPARHVLVVDDSPDLLILLGKLIARMGYQVTTSPSVAHALEVLSEQRVDLLITDWAMPEAGGGDLICALKREARWRDLPIAVLTGHDTDTERSDAQAAGCDRFLVKPIMRDELQTVIEEMLPKN